MKRGKTSNPKALDSFIGSVDLPQESSTIITPKINNMTPTLTTQQSEEIFHTALCNAIGTGYMNSYGIEMDFSEKDYQEASNALLMNQGDGKASSLVCYEDVLMEILRMGNTLTLVDHEGDGDMTRSITLKDVHERVQKTPANHLQDMIDENDDATTADVIIQTVFFQEVVFG